MGKEFKDWVDEFVDNGANPKDVTNWPKNGGGGQGGSETITLVQFAEYVDGKHLSVDALLNLFLAKGIINSLDPDIGLGAFFIGDYLYGDYYGNEKYKTLPIIGTYYESGNYLGFFGQANWGSFDLYTISDLISNKEEIENIKFIYRTSSEELETYIYIPDYIPYTDFGSNSSRKYSPCISLNILYVGYAEDYDSDKPKCYSITVEELKSLFVE